MSTDRTRAATHLPDHIIMRALWPVLLAAVVSLFPFTIYSTFLVPIAEDAGIPLSLGGTLRGLGGVAALIVGVGIAPLIARWSGSRATAAGLVLLAVACLVGAHGTAPALVLFCIGIGAATAVLMPALLGIATAKYTSRSDAGRAATIVTATQSLAAVLAAPVIGAMGVWNGWRGALWITCGLAAVVTALFVRGPAADAKGRGIVPPLGYRQAFAQLRSRRDLLSLIGIAFLRTASFMGYLSFLAAHYHDRFGLDPTTFTLVWTLSGASFFTGNYLAGRWVRSAAARRQWLLISGLLSATVATAMVFSTSSLPVALAATSLMGLSHAVVAAFITTLIAQRGGALAGPAFSINAAGMSLGVLVGAVLGGFGLSIAGSLGLTVALSVPTLAALLLVRPALQGRGLTPH